MSHKLSKPCTDIKRADFIVEHNHKRGLLIKETDSAIYALEPWEKLVDDEVIDNTEEYEKEQAKIRADYISNLKLTAADVERAIYKAKGMDFEDIVAMVETLKQVQGDNSDNSICHAELVSASQTTSEETLNTTGVPISHEIEDFSERMQVQGDKLDIDIKALKIELRANNFYRGNPYVDAIGSLLGFSKEMLDEFFETNDYTKLISQTH